MPSHSHPPATRKIAPVLVIFLAFTVHYSAAKKCPSKSWLVDRIRPLRSSTSTLSSRINEIPAERDVVSKLLGHFQDLDKTHERGEEDRGIWLCSQSLKRFAINARVHMVHKSLGWLDDCGKVIDDNGDTSGAKNHFDALMEFSRIVKKHSLSVVRDYGLSWRKTFLNEVLQYEPPDVTRRCYLATSMAFRIKGKWALVSTFTNVSVEIAMPKWKRGYLQETISQGRGGTLSPVPYKIPLCPKVPGKKKRELKMFENGTAAVSTFGGRPGWSHFGTPLMRENPAITLAVRRGDHERELVEDSETLSNLAILLLPACLALVPLGLFQDVSVGITLMYTLATDVFSVLPVAITGIELLVYSQRQHYGTVSHLYGAKNSTDLAVVETWVARCQLRDKYRLLGTSLLCTALVAMTLGMLLEFITRAVVKRKLLGRLGTPDLFGKEHQLQAQNGGLLHYLNRSYAKSAYSET